VVNTEFGHSPYTGDRPGLMELGEVGTPSVAPAFRAVASFYATH
jgi:hypothetical protein